jgi:hypothetical protein
MKNNFKKAVSMLLKIGVIIPKVRADEGERRLAETSNFQEKCCLNYF